MSLGLCVGVYVMIRNISSCVTILRRYILFCYSPKQQQQEEENYSCTVIDYVFTSFRVGLFIFIPKRKILSSLSSLEVALGSNGVFELYYVSSFACFVSECVGRETAQLLW